MLQPKEKWGRHCCRPHSHRRVDPEGYFTPDVSPQASLQLCRPTLASVPDLCLAGSDPEDLSLASLGSETVSHFKLPQADWGMPGGTTIPSATRFADPVFPAMVLAWDQRFDCGHPCGISGLLACSMRSCIAASIWLVFPLRIGRRSSVKFRFRDR